MVCLRLQLLHYYARSLDESKRGECTGYASAVFTLSGAIASIIGGFIVTKLNNYNLVSLYIFNRDYINSSFYNYKN